MSLIDQCSWFHSCREPTVFPSLIERPGLLVSFEARHCYCAWWIYMIEAIAKEWIQPDITSAAIPVLFVLEKDGSLGLCIDCRGSNNRR